MLFMSMKWRHTAYVFGVLALAAISGGGTAYAEPQHYTSREFLQLTQDQRKFFYAGAFTALGHLVSQYDEQKSGCIWGWFFDKPDERTVFLEDVMRKYPEQSPTLTFIGVLQKDCGKFWPEEKAGSGEQ
jgi:hypothetical protein